MPTDIKKTIGENTEKVEQKAKEYWTDFSPYYSNLEPWQRGLILLGLLAGTTAIIYWLIHDDKDKLSRKKEQSETIAEERLLRKMEFFKKLQK